MFTQGTTDANYVIFAVVVILAFPPVLLIQRGFRGTVTHPGNGWEIPARVEMDPELTAWANRLVFRAGLALLGFWAPALVVATWFLPVDDLPVWYLISIPIWVIAYSSIFFYPLEVIKKYAPSE